MRKSLLAAIMAASALVPAAAMAQDNNDRPQREGRPTPGAEGRTNGRQQQAVRQAGRQAQAPQAGVPQGQAQARAPQVQAPQNQALQGQPQFRGGRPDGQAGRGGYRGGQYQGQVPGAVAAPQRQVQGQVQQQRSDGRGGFAGGQRNGDFRGNDGRFNDGRPNDGRGFGGQGNDGRGQIRGNDGRGYDRGGYNNGNAAWSRDWRRDNRYNYNAYRNQNRNAYHLPRYYAPNGWGGGYRRFGIGFSLSSILYGQDYWIDDADYYRLPPAYGPYRWVRYYNDALLVDIRTGYVVDTVYDIFW